MSSMSIDDSTETAVVEPKHSSTDVVPDSTQESNQQSTPWRFGVDSDNNDKGDAEAPSYAFGVANNSNTENSDTNNLTPVTFGTDNSSNPVTIGNDHSNSNNNDNEDSNNKDNNAVPITFGTDNSSNPADNNLNTVTFGVTNNDNNNTPPPPVAFGVENNTNPFAFGVTNNDDENNNDKNDNNDSVPITFGTDNTSNPVTFGTDNTSNAFTFGVPNNDNGDSTNHNNDESNENPNPAPFSFGVKSLESSSATTPSTNFVWQPNANNDDPFATFNSSANNEDNAPSTATATPLNNVTGESTTESPPATEPPPPSVPVPDIPHDAIDHEAQKKFRELFRQQTQGKWCCESCSNYNSDSIDICESCEVKRKDAPAPQKGKAPPLIQTPCKVSTTPFGNESKEGERYSYYKLLSENNEILNYDSISHPRPRYFPYQHDEKEEELNEEGPAAWMQFDDDDGDDDDSDDIAEKEEEAENEDGVDEKVRAYREYVQRRNACKQQLNLKSTKDTKVMIAMAGDGSMGGQLGIGNGSVTQIPNNIASFPFVLDSKELMGKEIKCTATGIMSTAVVTKDNEIYVWGLNDKSELTINPQNINDVDVGDDDDQLAPDIAWQRLYNHYFKLITEIYQDKNPTKLEKDGFVESLLNKRKYGKIKMYFGGKSKITQGALGDQQQIEKIRVQFESQCRLELEQKKKKSNKQGELKWSEEIDIEQTADGMHELYTRVCKKNGVPPEDQSPLFIPKATEEEMLERKHRKLNPYKYLHESDSSDDDMADVDDKERNKKKTNGEAYEQKKNERDEDTFQGTLSCSYWTPAHIQLPYKMVVEQVTLGGTHMVVLDQLGQVWSSGTFMNEGPVGHHYDEENKVIVRYQRTLKRISHLSKGSGTQSTQVGKNNTLPLIKSIASGANHFLMLDVHGNIWKMGVTKLGQRWCPRNTKNYLCPQRVCNASTKNRRGTKRVKFEFIACGNHHNVAISTTHQLYAWGQNIWMQCGFKKEECGYGNVVDQPRWVPFYKQKKDLNDVNEKDEWTEYKVQKVVAGEHMTVALDVNGGVWTCGRNACGALGRKTRSEGVKDYGIQKVKTEVQPDVMRKVVDLKHIGIDWIGCGSVIWFAHNKQNGAVYAFGDASSGRAGIGQWKYARGRPVFDEHNLNTKRYQVTSANGGSDHVIFTIKKEQRRKHRHSTMSSSNSRESSLSLEESSVANGTSNHNDWNTDNLERDPKDAKNNKFSKTNRIPSRTTRKRTFNMMTDINEEGEEEEEEEENNEEPTMVEPERKRLKLAMGTPSNCKPQLENNSVNSKTAPVAPTKSNV